MADTKYMERQYYSATLGEQTYQVYVSLGGESVSGIFNVLDYGAAGDGSTDDSAAIQDAIDACEATIGGTVKIPGGLSYLIGTGLVVSNSNSSKQFTIDMEGARLLSDTGLADAVLQIKDNVKIVGGYIGTSSGSADWTDTVGIRILNGYRSRVYDTQIRNMEKGIEMKAETGRGCPYNHVAPSMIYDCKYGIYITQAGSGYVNDNVFVDASIYYSANLDGTDVSGGSAIYMDRTATPTNVIEGNEFIGVSLENASNGATAAYHPKAIYGEACVYTNFRAVRIEGFDDTTPVYFDSDCEGLSFVNCPSLEDTADFNAFKVVGMYRGRRTNKIEGENTGKTGGGPALSVVSRDHNDGEAIFDIKDSSGNVLFSVDGNGSIGVLPQAEPTTPAAGQIYYDSTANKLKVYTGSAWETITSA